MKTIQLVDQPAHRTGALAQRALWGVLLALGLALALASPARAQETELPALCADVSVIPPQECGALAALYTATDGPNWLENANWGTVDASTTPCDWYGVGCVNGHVQTLELARNNLTGKLPAALGQLDQLQMLNLAGNALGPRMTSRICDLTDTVTAADLGYNRLAVRGANTRGCLAAMDPDWQTTQTAAPSDLAVTALGADSIELAWTPIPYDGDGGYYEVSYSETLSGNYTIHGVTADRAATGYTIDGLAAGTSYFVRVRSVTPAHANHPFTLTSEPAWALGVTQGETRMLLAVVIAADNNLSAYVPSILRRIQRGTALNPNLTAVVLADRRGPDNTQIGIIENGNATALDVLQAVWGSEELDMADPAVLTWFLDYARDLVDAERTMVSLIGHGIGPTPDLAWVPETEPGEPPAPPVDGIPPLPRGLEYSPADVTDGSYLSTHELAQALLDATVGGAEPFDIVFFDQCFQGNLDVLYEVRNTAEVFIASPNYAWLIAPYAQYISQMAPASDNESIAEDIISRYSANLNNRHPHALFWVRSGDIAQIADAVSQLGDALLDALADDRVAPIRNAALNAAFVDTTQCGRGEFVLGPPDELMGAGSFALNLRQSFGPDDAYGVHAAAGQLLQRLTRLSSVSQSGSPYLAPDTVWDYSDRITLLAPLVRTLPASVVWRASVYQAADQQEAIWTPDPDQTVLVQGSYAFVKEHRWDEFIGAWYGDLTPTVGTWCHYTPPSIVIEDDAEVLALEVQVAGDNLGLSWSAPTEADPAAYQILGRLPFGINLELLDVVPADVTATELDNLIPGDYVLQIVALDENDASVAASGEAKVTLPWTTEVYLPVVEKGE